MTDKICVYFNNNYRAVLDRKDVVIVYVPDELPRIATVKQADKTVVNWDNVCFVRPYEEKEEDEP